MSDSFPNEIDLGSKPSDPIAASPSGSKQGKSKKYYPTLYIGGVEGLEELPKEGEALIKFRRKRLSSDVTDAGEKYSAELEVLKLCLPNEEENPDEYSGDEDDFDKAARKAGIDTGKKAQKEEDEDED